MEADLAVLVADDFFDTTHGTMDCRDCHGGVKFAKTRAEAHEGMEPLPSSAYAESVCQPCHPGIADTFANTLHADTRGVSDSELALVLDRVGDGNMDAVQQGLENNCGTCHVSGCGDCHVTRPQFNDGGFVRGHVFYKSPNSSLNCMGCHGSRVEKEFTGKGESDACELTADTHWNPGGMQCYDCHTVDWIHGGDEYDARYDSPNAPQCEDCHPQSAEFLSNGMHNEHARPDAEAYLQCQVCHAQDYNNCTSCHVALDDNELPFFETSSSYFDFNIGNNVEKSEDRPWDYVVVRHVPVDEGTFDFYGEGGLADFDAAPTFKYATPHSISLSTRQTENGCGGCHGDDDLFLTEEDFANLPEVEKAANADVIVDRQGNDE